MEYLIVTYTLLSHSPASSAMVKLSSGCANSQVATEAASSLVRPTHTLSFGAVMELKPVHADSEAGGLYVELSHRRPRTPLLRSAFLALSAACCLHGSFGLGRAMVTVIEENSRSADVNEVEENLMMNRGTDFHSRGKTLDRAPLSQVRCIYTGAYLLLYRKPLSVIGREHTQDTTLMRLQKFFIRNWDLPALINTTSRSTPQIIAYASQQEKLEWSLRAEDCGQCG